MNELVDIFRWWITEHPGMLVIGLGTVAVVLTGAWVMTK